MGQQLERDAIRGYSYFIIVILAVMQGIVITATTDYAIRIESQLSATTLYLPILLAIFVPSAISYLITNAKSGIFYLNIVVIIGLIFWLNYWHAQDFKNPADTDPFFAFITLTVLFFFMLPWMQLWQVTRTWKIDYGCLMGLYIKNTFLGVLAAAIGGLLTLIIKIASFLFDIVNLNFLSEALDNDVIYWVSFALGFNMSLVFLRATLNVQLSNLASFIARFFLPLLNIVAVIFLGGFVVSYFSGLSSTNLGSAVMLWFLILNLIFINFVYGDGTNQYQYRTGLNGFVLVSIILLNAFSVLSLYGILVRVNQYSWSVERLYAFTIALFLFVLVFAYSIAIIYKRSAWMSYLGFINKAGILSLIAIILVINSPIADFKRITLNSILAGVENGKIKVNSSLAYDLKQLGEKGLQAFEQLNNNPEYQKLFQTSPYEEEQRKPLKSVLIQAKNSPTIPDNWFDLGENLSTAWYCTSQYDPYPCVGFMADVNQNNQNDVVMCYSYPSSSSIDCNIWQQTEQSWELMDTQTRTFNTMQEKAQAWDNLLKGNFKLKPKEWLMIDPTS
ncbi:DUF4153 domain-containing protein [Providencia rettgeri]|uniref:DUF7057 domain-containing protein n=1 Tax=Providencia rettgeri TaxID=587 RepID=UPI0018E4D6C5|nr:DUF4153 domain-containing protein [Providencia rettgeri]MBI6195011.1 DUF4153 domain-containing protein [Providencia rettgeri]